MATRADKDNNPTNIKVPSGGLAIAAQRYGDPGISVDPNPAQDGGQFLKFSSPQSGFKAAATLLKDPSYSGLTVDQALKRWSGGGYGGEIVPSYANSTVSSLSQDDLDAVTQSMAKREGYGGQTGGQATGSPGLLSTLFGVPTANAQTIDSTQGTKPTLTHDQLVANINAMEQQGAQPQEIQQYLDGLKSGQSQNQSSPHPDTGGLVHSVPSAPSTAPVPSNPGFIQSAVQGLTGFIPKLASSVADVGLQGTSIAQQLLGNKQGAADTEQRAQDLENNGMDFGYFGKNVTPLGHTGSALGDFKESAGTGIQGGLSVSSAVGAGGLLKGLFQGGTALTSAPVMSILEKEAGEESVKSLSASEMSNALSYGLSDAEPAAKPIIQQAINQLAPDVAKEAGAVPSLLQQIVQKSPSLAWKIIKSAAKLGVFGEVARGGVDIKSLLGI